MTTSAGRTPRPFSAHEWAIAWRYLRATRKDGGISVVAGYALVGVMLGVATLIVVQAVMIGFREEFTDRILGANPHVQILAEPSLDEWGGTDRLIRDYDALAARVAELPFVTRTAPVVRGQVMASMPGRNAGVEVTGIRTEDLAAIPLVAQPEIALGDLSRLPEGVALGYELARELGAGIGDIVTITSPDGMDTPFGTQPRINDYEVVYIFRVGRWDVDRVRVYMPLEEAQSFFDRDEGADAVEVFVTNPQEVERNLEAIAGAAGPGAYLWTWRDSAGAFLEALDVERRVMFIILSLVVLIAALNIISGLVMLVKNKGRDIGILRTMGLTSGAIMRIFFLCGALIGIVGTALGVVLGIVFALNIEAIQSLVEGATGGSVWNPEVRFLTEIPARIRLEDVLAVVALALGLSFLVTLYPARSAARLNPVEALRYE